MSKRIGLIVLFALLLFEARAQQKLNYVEVDKKSYELFQQKKWHELIDFADEARQQGIDFFYLQVRTGIAWYNLKKYTRSTRWFLKAWESDQSFDWLQEYLYYSLVFSGRAAEASKYAAVFDNKMKEKIGWKRTKLTRLALEGGYSFNPDFDKLSTSLQYETAGVGSDYGEAFYLKNYSFQSFDLSHQVGPGFSLNHNFTHIGVNREEQVYWGDLKSYNAKINQYQYFINPYFMLGKKWHVSSSLNLVWGDADFLVGGIRNNGSGYFYKPDSKYSDFIFSTSGWTYWGNFSPGAEVNLANIYNQNFAQFSTWVTFYPFSNLNFYLTPRVYFKSDPENGFGYNTFGISSGLKVGPVYLVGQYWNGEMKNFIESSGYVIANFPGKSSRKYVGSAYFPIGKKLQFVLRYMNQDITENYTIYAGGIKSGSMEYSYIKHTLTGGISWNF